ncbi:MAG: hypothetical protein FJ095_15475 [Deltaproteobacteria bacterium]|nr:hypothetical protein [Deltaproteobacteria bacterium]
MPDQPRPRRPLRTVTLAALVGVAALSGATAWGLHREARYALEGEVPMELGSLATAELDGRHEGRYVRARVELDGQPTYSFHRLGEGERRLARTAFATPTDLAPRGAGEVRAWGNGPPRFVDHSVSAELGAHFVPPRLVAGRLVRVEHLGLRHRGLAAAAAEVVPEAAAQGWVLVDGEHPRSLTWVTGAFGVALAFLVWSVGSVARLVRREPAA